MTFLWFGLSSFLRSKSGRYPNKKNIFSKLTKRTTTGQCNLLGTRAVYIPSYNKIVSRYDECYFSSQTIIPPNLWKGNWVWCQKCNVWYDEICFGVKGKRQFICVRCQWLELYHQVIGIVPTEVHFLHTVRSFLIFFNNNAIKHFHIKTATLLHLHRTRFSTDKLFLSCILHIKECFVRNDRNCTTLPY